LPRAGGHGVAHEVAKVPGLASQGLLHAIGEVGDAPWIGWGERLSQIGPSRWLQTHARDVEPVLRSDSLRVQLSALSSGVGVGLVPEPSVEPYGLVPLKLAAPLREPAAQLPADELFLVTHRALRDVPRVRVIWDVLVEKIGARLTGRPPPRRRPGRRWSP